ncbi:MAG: formate hydrogenlyase [Ignavibacteria bacterium RIFCSPLOWO2_02_FULL_55_14]|nr:MAG: formate hydrogenlyase [Ignavibacteria bacterium RIFCSPHIGHO2_02_FULL_56_12]OGU74691.1 MAG: formate hydrogenlyase [Ignavibacteria bacterium RIFCSPLOWO2_02_FULL_55_14]
MSEFFGVILISLFQLLLVLATGPLVNGIIKKTKARFQRRRGASVLQPYFDLAKLFRKEVVVPFVASWLFRTTPYLVFASTLVIALLVPTVATPVPLHWMGDIITVIYLFALGRFFVALVGLDTGGAFGGLGSSREMSIASIIEPAMMLAIFTVAVTAGSTNLSVIVGRLTSSPASMLNPAHLLAFSGLFIVTLAETGRVPVDNPATHLELTMIHEAMILEYSGRYLALIEWASQMKLIVFLALLSNMFFPLYMATTWSPWALLIGSAAFFGKIIVLAVVVAVVESTNAKLRLFRVPELLMVAFILSLLALILYFIIGA